MKYENVNEIKKDFDRMPLCIACHDLDVNEKIYLEENYRLSKN